jgi:choline dehydrogenase
MGNDADAVVDAELRVHGIPGLRIADASIMPRITSGNTCSPTLMIAEKAAHMILNPNTRNITPELELATIT